MAAPVERLEQLESIEKEIASVLHYAVDLLVPIAFDFPSQQSIQYRLHVETNWDQKGQAIQELSKDKTNVKNMEGHTASFLKTLEAVEMGLSKQIGYLTQVSTGQPHEGSSYASQKVLQMAYHRLEHARSRIADLEKLRNQHMQSRPPIQRQSMPSAAT